MSNLWYKVAEYYGDSLETAEWEKDYQERGYNLHGWHDWQPLVKAQFPDQKTAGANGNLPEGIQFEHSEDEHDHHITARVPGAKGYNWGDEGTVGRLSWTKHDLDPDTSPIHEISRPLDAGTVTDVDVHPDYQRRGIASAMWEQAKTHADRFQVPGPYHSELQTDEGQEWAARIALKVASELLSQTKCSQCPEKRFADHVTTDGQTQPLCQKHYRDKVEPMIRYREIKDDPTYDQSYDQ